MDTLKRTREIDQVDQSKRKYKIKKGREQNIDEEPKKKTKTTRKTRKNNVTQKLTKKGQCQSQIETKTVMFLSRKVSTEKSTKWKLKIKIGLNT